ncbi:hypothetical protein CDAR_377461 [Caerostris darwini]|uniref:Uncharacterized protein n=1 Tax=Caerostris darwini TaxID=1538125 RepID=A0AAV4W2V8_9ARAC|nr:hypothetical protein CDAR_377461 [Caerostris darwini]
MTFQEFATHISSLDKKLVTLVLKQLRNHSTFTDRAAFESLAQQRLTVSSESLGRNVQLDIYALSGNCAQREVNARIRRSQNQIIVFGLASGPTLNEVA